MEIKAKNKTTGEIREFEKLLQKVSPCCYSNYYQDNEWGSTCEKCNRPIMRTIYFLSEWEVIDEPKQDCPCNDGANIVKQHLVNCKYYTPSSLLEDKIKSELAVFWDKIAENLPKSFERSALGDEKIFIAFNAVYPEIRNYWRA